MRPRGGAGAAAGSGGGCVERGEAADGEGALAVLDAGDTVPGGKEGSITEERHKRGGNGAALPIHYKVCAAL